MISKQAQLESPMICFLSRYCTFCQMRFNADVPLCHRCQQQLIRLEKACITCGESTSFSSCDACALNGTDIHRLYVHWTYSEPLKTLIHRFKFQQDLHLRHYLAHLMAAHLPPQALDTECLIPVPLHTQKLKSRGFHQTLLLAKTLSKNLKIPVSAGYCKKIKDTLPQMQLNRDERLFNLQNTFECRRPPYQHITLIDDITTTGSTLKQMAQQFQQLGVNCIDAWTIAKA